MSVAGPVRGDEHETDEPDQQASGCEHLTGTTNPNREEQAMSNLQDAIMALVAQEKAQALSQTDILSLGELTEKLRHQPPTNVVKVERHAGLHNPGDVDSYRGYYSDLYIDFTETEERTVASLLANLEAADGETFTGYKGGDFTMSRSTPVWVDQYSCCDGIGATGVEERDGITVITSGECDAF